MKYQNNPDISILIPLYNVEKYILKCIQSIQNQTLKNWELILIDDGSKDSTLNIIQQEEKKDSRIHVYSYENAGVSVARNRALEHVHSPYLTFIDSDDYIHPNMLEDMLEFMKDHKCDIVTCGYFIDFPKWKLPTRLCPKKCMNTKEAIDLLIQKKGMDNYAWGKIYKKECFENIQFPVHANEFEDAYTIFKVILKAKKIGAYPKRYYHYVQREGSLTHHMDLKTVYDMRASFEYQEKELKKLYPNDDFHFDIQYFNADMMLIYTILFYEDKTKEIIYKPANIQWKKLNPILHFAYKVWIDIAKIRVKSLIISR